MPLQPGAVAFKDMDQRQSARWCREQSIDNQIDGALTDAIAAHVAESDPHTQYLTEAAFTAAMATVTSGTYTPTLTQVANLSAATAYECQYLRVGSVVTASGRVVFTVVASATVQLGISLPVASNFAAVENCGGTAASSLQAARIRADATNDRAELIYDAVTIGSNEMSFSFSYRVI